MPQRIDNQTTQAAYTNALTLGPDNFEAITFAIYNFPCYIQVWNMPQGAQQQGDWQGELLLAPGTTTLTRCGGVRFRTATSAAQVIGYAWKDDEVVIASQVAPSGTLTAGGGFVPFSPTTVEVTDGSVDVNPTTKINIGAGLTLTSPSAGVATVVVTNPVLIGSQSQQLANDVNTSLPNNQTNQRVKVGSTFGASFLDLSNNANPKWLTSGKYSVMCQFGGDNSFPFAVGSYYLYQVQSDNAGFNALAANTYPASANNLIPSAVATVVGDVLAGDSLFLLAGQRPAGSGTPPQVNVQVSINRIA